jgi:nicotinamidase-related amidase
VKKAAVLSLHFQNDVVADGGAVALGLAALPALRAHCLGAAARLLAGARAAGVPVISVRIAFAPGHTDLVANGALFRAVAAAGALVEGSWGADFVPALAPLPGETVITHRRVNAFHETGLERLLAEMGVRQLVITGVASNSTVEHSARHGADLGLDVIVAEDGCASARADLHEAALENIRLIGRTLTVDSILADWAMAA